MGQGPRFAIGGFLRFASCIIWFSESFEVADFAFANLTLSSSASDDISCYECLAQIALLHCASAVTSSGRLHVRIPSWTDNTGAEAVANKLYTSRYPLCIVCLLSGWRFSAALQRWSWTLRTYLGLGTSWQTGFPAGTAPIHCQMDWILLFAFLCTFVNFGILLTPSLCSLHKVSWTAMSLKPAPGDLTWGLQRMFHPG